MALADLPQPPPGYFWRVRRSIGDIRVVELRKTILRVFSYRKDHRLMVGGLSERFLIRTTEEILDSYNKNLHNDRLLGDYYRY